MHTQFCFQKRLRRRLSSAELSRHSNTTTSVGGTITHVHSSSGFLTRVKPVVSHNFLNTPWKMRDWVIFIVMWECKWPDFFLPWDPGHGLGHVRNADFDEAGKWCHTDGQHHSIVNWLYVGIGWRVLSRHRPWRGHVSRHGPGPPSTGLL